MKDIRNIFSFLAPFKSKVSLSLICHILSAIFTIVTIPLIIPFFHFLFSTIPDSAERPESLLDVVGWLEYYFVALIGTYGSQRALVIICGFLVLTFFLKNLFRYLAMYYMIPVRSSIVMGLRKDLYDKYLDQSLEELQSNKRGDLITRITADVQEVEWGILRFIQTLFKAPVLILGSTLLMLSIHTGLTLFVFILMVFTGLVIGTLSKTLKKSSNELQGTLSELTTRVDESLDGALHLRIFRVIDSWKEKFTGTNARHKDLYDKVTRRQELSSPLSEFLGVTVVVVLLWWGAQLVFDRSLKPEAFFAFVFAFYHVIEPLKSFSTAFYNIKKGSASLERIHQLTEGNAKEDLDRAHNFSFHDKIVFDQVSFSYEDGKVLDNISLVIYKGERIAIVGNSGAGKSTLVSLLLGVIRPDYGNIYFDNMPLHQISKKQYYKNIGLVTQQAFLYNDSVRENLTLGRANISDRQIAAALTTANASDFVARLSEKGETKIGNRGEQLSGGEGQRLTIARAVLENPELLILDEPTSSLDPASEHKVSAAILQAMKGRTTVIIAHKLTTIKHCDRILFLENGKIVEAGTHNELVANKGKYHDYVALQAL